MEYLSHFDDCIEDSVYRIYVDLPDAENRLKILKIFLTPENLETGFEFEKLAKETEGYSGSDLKVWSFTSLSMMMQHSKFIVVLIPFGFYIAESMHSCCLQTCARIVTRRKQGKDLHKTRTVDFCCCGKEFL